MRVNFIIPNIPNAPSGGHKIMYEYANEFAAKGHDVHLYHVATIDRIKYNMPHWLRMIRTRLFFPDSKPKWFDFDKRIQTHNIPRISKELIRPADANILTMWAEVLNFQSIGDTLGKRINLIQGYETWMASEDDVHKSYQTGTINIAISEYLADKVEDATGERPHVIKNFISSNFQKKKELADRSSASVSMLYSTITCKGSSWGIKALDIVKKQIPQLQVEMFGIFNRPDNLPAWINYTQRPKDLCALYNSVSIHISPSINDGWDLPCTEAMKCGCALVCTDIAGHKEYARDGETALLVQPQDAEALAESIIKMIQDDELRSRIASNGLQEAEKYTLEIAYQKLITIIQS
jgi:glycosyltransferase involved in cell wall biosynthesis